MLVDSERKALFPSETTQFYTDNSWYVHATHNGYQMYNDFFNHSNNVRYRRNAFLLQSHNQVTPSGGPIREPLEFINHS